MKQIETPYLPDPIMRRPRADREEKRVIHGNESTRHCGEPEQLRKSLDEGNPKQRGLLAPSPCLMAVSTSSTYLFNPYPLFKIHETARRHANSKTPLTARLTAKFTSDTPKNVHRNPLTR